MANPARKCLNRLAEQAAVVGSSLFLGDVTRITVAANGTPDNVLGAWGSSNPGELEEIMKAFRVVFAVLVGVLTFIPPPAYTGALRCRSDPVVVLSNGTLIDLSADVDAMLWEIASVNYTLHVPQGLRAILIVRTPNWPGTKETFRVVDDQPAKTFDSTTTVLTMRRGVGVTANLLVNLQYAAARGWDGQPLRVGVTTR
jgi:hypothetical protein